MDTEQHQDASPQNRLLAYWDVLKVQKERKTVREILEREVLLCFINANKDRINEFPLLGTQQHTVINFLTTRAHDDPLHEHNGALITFFINQLNKYGSLLSTGDTTAAEREVPSLINYESLLLKAVQGVVYTTALTLDTFSEVLIKHYGEDALHPIDAIIETVELSERFWKEHFDHFIEKLADSAYREITATQQYLIRREKSQLVIRFNFDDILSRLKRTDKHVEKTRAQTVFEENTRTFEVRKAKKSLAEHLLMLSQQQEYPFAQADIAHIAQIVCMDPAGISFEAALNFLKNTMKEGATDADNSPITEDSARFIVEQVLAMACSTAVSLNIIRHDIQKSLQMFEKKEAAQIMSLLGVFDFASIERAFFTMLEYQFLAILRQRAGEDIGKLQIRSMRLRRVREKDLIPLADEGLNRIRKTKLWLKDPDNDEYLIFAKQLPKDFKEMIELMHLEPKLIQKIFTLWQKASFKVYISVHLNLDLLSRTTTNINQRLSEILLRFGTMGPGQKNGA